MHKSRKKLRTEMKNNKSKRKEGPVYLQLSLFDEPYKIKISLAASHK